nr:DNA adenine methylase [Membranihabitans maritimus]
MGSKHKLLSWISHALKDLSFETALDGFSGSGAVSYLLKTMGKSVTSNDFLHFSHILTRATVENNHITLDDKDMESLLTPHSGRKDFIQKTFKGIFFTPEDLLFLDNTYAQISEFSNPYKKSLALTCLIRACVKKQPRGVFTVSGDLSNYNDGRRDLRISMKQHFTEQINLFNELIFDNGHTHYSINQDIFAIENPEAYDLVYLDPPYVPRSDDNCYVKRYHFLEGLSKYWEKEEILYDTKVHKIKKKYTPFSYRSKAVEAFDRMFDLFRSSIIVLSYSSNGYPHLKELTSLLGKHKKEVFVLEKDHQYHFGNHKKVTRSKVKEYLIIGK